MVSSQERGFARVRDVASFLSVSRSKIYEMLESGELTSIRIGGCRRIPWSDVERFLRNASGPKQRKK